MYKRLWNIAHEGRSFRMAVPHLRLLALAPDMLRGREARWFGCVENRERVALDPRPTRWGLVVYTLVSQISDV